MSQKKTHIFQRARRMFLLFSHKLTDAQVENAQATFGPLEFLYLPEHLQVIWSAVNPEGELPADALDDIVHFVLDESQPDDIVLVQGDFGAVFYLVDACFSAGRIPVYATTHRRCEEIRNDDGSVSMTHTFSHVQFRRYRRYTHA